MYIEKLVISNFRCFEKTELVLNYPGRDSTLAYPNPQRVANVNLFVGSNGSGKSSIFKALALGVLAPIIRNSGLNAEYLVRRQKAKNGNLAQSKSRKKNADVRAYLILDEIDTDSLPEKNQSVLGQAVIRRLGDVEEINTAHNNLDFGHFVRDKKALHLKR